MRNRPAKLDLAEVTLVDVDVVRFLGNKEREGVNWLTVRDSSESGLRESNRSTQCSRNDSALMRSEAGE